MGLVAVLRPVFAILLGCVSFEIAAGLISPLVTVQLVGRDTATELIGLVFAAYFVGFIVGTLTCARIIDRAGHIRAMCVFSVLTANVTLMFAMTESPWVWMMLRACHGFAMAGTFVIIESWLNDKATPATRGKILAAYQVVGWSTGGLAPLGLNLTDPQGPLLFMVGAIGFATALIPVALTRIGDPEIGQRSRFGLRKLFTISPVGVTVGFGSGLVNSVFFGLLPVYMAAQGFTTGELTIALSVATLGGLLVQIPAGVASDRFGRRPVILIGLAVALVPSVAALVVGAPTFAMLLGIVFVFAFGAGQLYPVAVAQTNDHLTPRDFVAASGGLLCAWAIGAAIGAGIGAEAMAVLGASGLFIFEVAVLGVLAAFTIYRMTRRPGRAGRVASTVGS